MQSPADVLIARRCIEAYDKCRQINGKGGLVRFFQEMNAAGSSVSAELFLSQGRITGVRYTLNDGALAPVTCTGSKIKFTFDENSPNFGAGKGSIFAKHGWLSEFNVQHDLPQLQKCTTVHELQAPKSLQAPQLGLRRDAAPRHQRPAPAPTTPAPTPAEPKACLYTNSTYTAYGTLTPEEIAQTARAQGFTHVALTDVATVTGVPRFVRACNDNGITPLVGTDIAVRGLPGTQAGQDTRLTLIVQNDEGWRNLSVLLTAASLNKHTATSEKDIAMNAAAWVDWRDMQHLAGGLLVISRGASGPLQQAGADSTALSALQSAFGKGLVYADTPLENVPQASNASLVAGANKPPRMAEVRWKLFRHTLESSLGAGAAARITDGLAPSPSPAPALTDDAAFVQQCAPLGGAWKLSAPKLQLPQGITAHEILSQMAHEGLQLRLAQLGIAPDSEQARIYEERNAHELSIINKTEFSDYFLIVYGTAWQANTMGGEQSCGLFVRGSAAGSSVLWSLGASQIDPIANNLPFERFLNPMRRMPPDVDMDTSNSIKNGLQQWFMQISPQQGQTAMQTSVRISAHAQRGDDAALLAAGQINGCKPLAEALLQWSKGQKIFLTPAKEASKLWLLQKNLPALARHTQATNEELTRLLNDAALLRGTHTRLENKHPSGIVLCNRPAFERFPCVVEPSSHGTPTLRHTQDTDGADFFGDIKFDLLASEELARQSAVITLINSKNKAAQISQRAWQFLTAENSPDIRRALDLLSREAIGKDGRPSARVQGVFQLNRWAGRKAISIANRLLRAKKRNWSLKTVTYVNALARQGRDLKRDNPSVRYQEDIMRRIAQFAALDIGTADLMRRSLEKGALPPAQKSFFAEHAKSAGHSEQEIETELAQLSEMSSYTFNKAHAAGYGLVIMRCAWLKANFPQEFAEVYSSSLKEPITDLPETPSPEEQKAAIARAARDEPMPAPHEALLLHTPDGVRINLHLQPDPTAANSYIPQVLTGAAPAQPEARANPPEAPKQQVPQDAMAQMRERVEVAASIWQSALADGRDLRSDAGVTQAVHDFCPEGVAPDDVMPSALLIHDTLAIGGVRAEWGTESLQFFFKLDRQQAEHMQMVAEAVQERELLLTAPTREDEDALCAP